MLKPEGRKTLPGQRCSVLAIDGIDDVDQLCIVAAEQQRQK
jgi:hypothetical protein